MEYRASDLDGFHGMTWVENPEGKRPLGRSRRSWDVNIRLDLGKMGWESADWMHLARIRDQWPTLVNTVMNPRVP
jgi:hypothetical protein